MSKVRGFRDVFDVAGKDEDYVYRWCNSDERAMLRHQANGYETVQADKPELEINRTAGQEGTTLIKRGPDLVLMRVKRSVFEETVGARRQELREQHEGAMDAAIDQASENASRRLHSHNKNMRRQGLVFKTDATSGFGSN